MYIYYKLIKYKSKLAFFKKIYIEKKLLNLKIFTLIFSRSLILNLTLKFKKCLIADPI